MHRGSQDFDNTLDSFWALAADGWAVGASAEGNSRQTDWLKDRHTDCYAIRFVFFFNLCPSREPLVMTPMREEMRPPVSQVTTNAEGPWIVPSDAWIFFAAGAEQGLL